MTSQPARKTTERSEPFDAHEYWQRRAESFGKNLSQTPYATAFIELLDPPEGATIFDMGCATGTLAIPLAKLGHQVVACDFSSNMLDGLRRNAEIAQVEVETRLLDWNADWAASGIEQGCADIALASRSFPTEDLERHVRQLEYVARQKAAVTVPASALPSIDPELCEYLGRDVPSIFPNQRVLQTLEGLGRTPQQTLIPYVRPMRNPSRDWVVYELRKLAGPEPLDAREQALFERYADTHVVRADPRAGSGVQAGLEAQAELKAQANSEAQYTLDRTLYVDWAFISWEVG